MTAADATMKSITVKSPGGGSRYAQGRAAFICDS